MPFFSLKRNKSPGADEINFNVIKYCFGELCGPVKYLFDLSLRSGVFPDLMKSAIVSPIFKTSDTADISNYHPISVLPCFSKILERVIHNRLYNCLADEKILYPQHFGFRKGDPTEHAIVQPIDQIYKSFENDNYTVGIDTVDHTMLLKKLKI